MEYKLALHINKHYGLRDFNSSPFWLDTHLSHHAFCLPNILKCTFLRVLIFTTNILDIKSLNILLREEDIIICNTDVKEKRIAFLLQDLYQAFTLFGGFQVDVISTNTICRVVWVFAFAVDSLRNRFMLGAISERRQLIRESYGVLDISSCKMQS